jgi:hypothetical protein
VVAAAGGDAQIELADRQVFAARQVEHHLGAAAHLRIDRLRHRAVHVVGGKIAHRTEFVRQADQVQDRKREMIAQIMEAV